MGKKAKFLAGVFASFCILPNVAFADDAKAANAAEAPAASSDAAPDQRSGGGQESTDIVVTASRRSESLSKVPISIEALSARTMDSKGIRDIYDLARNTPGVTFDQAFGNATTIAIRGIVGSGQATTGIYIDDTPIQNRTLGVSSHNAYPMIFDLERVEVLLGPQGTLFGAGSEGGTVRFITPDPQLVGSSLYARTEVNGIEHGSMGYEYGAAYGTALVEDKLGIRVSAWHQHTGGYIDAVNEQTGDVSNRNINQSDADVLRAALTWKPLPNLTITPSIFYQDLHTGDIGRVGTQYSNADNGSFRVGQAFSQPSRDWFVLPALKMQYEGNGFTIYNNVSYLARNQHDVYDYSTLTPAFIFPSALTGLNKVGGVPIYQSYAEFWQSQHNVTEELRIQSNSKTSPFKWLIGGFYQKSIQTEHEDIVDNSVTTLIPASALGSLYLPGNRIYTELDRTVDKQYAAFADLSYTLFHQLTLNAGIRYAHMPSSGTTFIDGLFNGGQTANNGKTTDNAVTPKFDISWQFNPNGMVYARVSKGFRPGGITRVVAYDTSATPQTNQKVYECTVQQNEYGGQFGGTYKSDHLWSYEGGYKGSFFNHRLTVDADGYYIKWTNIQIDKYACGVDTVGNAGNAQAKGFEFALNGRPANWLTLGVGVSYVDATYTTSIPGAGPISSDPSNPAAPGYNYGGVLTNVSTSVGDALVANPWTVSANAQYDFHAMKQPAYFRIDYQYRGGFKATNAFNSQDSGYDPHIPLPPSYSYFTLRAGIKLKDDKIDASFFVKNLTNIHPMMNFGFEAPGYPVYGISKYNTFTPRTFGVTVTLRD